MEIKIKRHNGISVTATGIPDYLNKEEINEIADGICNVIHLINKHKDCHFTHVEEAIKVHMTNVEEKTEEIKKPIVKAPDKPLIRQRIPNNIVNIEDLSIEKAVTENALVRCPECGQAHCLAVKSDGHIYMMRRNFIENEFGIICEFSHLDIKAFNDMCCKEETNREAYYHDLQTMKFKPDKDFNVDNDSEIFCPVCCKSNSFGEWKNAFQNPLEYFETEQLCDACGGEKSETIVKGSKYYICDTCGLKTEQEDAKS